MLTCTVTCVPVSPGVETAPPDLPPPETEPTNSPPVIHSLTADNKVMVRSTGEIICKADDPDGDNLSFSWSADSGTIRGTGDNVTWTSPEVPGVSTVEVTVKDGEGGEAVASLHITVTDTPNRPPEIEQLDIQVQYPPAKLTVYPEIPIIERTNPLVKVSRLVDITCIASDPDDDTLSFTWDIPAGKLAGEGENIQWLAPTEPQRYIIRVTVTDTEGNTDTAKLAVDVECCI
jgi:chitinase